MTTLDFLQRVLPSQGFYCAFLENKKLNEFFDSVDSLEQYVLRCNKRKQNIYYAIASFRDDVKRTKANSDYCRVLTLDLDAKGTDDTYLSVKEAASELKKFVRAAGLPKPVVVFSGNGLHVYWVLDRDLQGDEWNPLNDGLRQLASQHGLKLDLAPSKNGMSLVLRPVGTHNPKGGREVKLVSDAPNVSVEAMRDLLLVGKVAEKTRAAKRQSTSKLLNDLVVESSLPPADSTLVQAKCKQVREMVADQAAVSEPEWYHLLGVAAYCVEPEQTAKSWSEKHPAYDPQTTLTKMYQWTGRTTGPTTCVSMEAARPGGCEGCPYKGTISTPCRLGSVFEEIAVTAPDDPVAQQVELPSPFKRTTQGIFVTINDVDSEICPFDIYPVGYGRDEALGYEVVRFHWNRLHKGWQELKFRQAFLAEGSGKEFVTAIADQGIVLKNKAQTGYFQLMLRSYMDELRKLRGMSNLYATMGWKENYEQFVIGSNLLTSTGEEQITLANIGDSANKMYTTKGELSDAVKFTKLIDRMDMPWIGNALLFSLATPLFEFTGLRGMTLSLYGPTGTGKTLTQLWQQSLWGDPNRLHGTAKFTQNALFSRMATLRNLPVTVDEATLMNDKDIGEFIMWTTQGKDKARLDKNSVEREVREWFTTVTVSTNRSMTSLLLDGNMESNAQLARVLELQVHKHKVFSKSSEAGRKIYHFVTNNYGHIGKKYLLRLVKMGESGIKAVIQDAIDNFQVAFGSKVKFSGDERFWENSLILMYVAGKIAEQEGLISFDFKRTIEWQLKQMNVIRREIRGIRKESMDYLSDYLNDHSGSAVTVVYDVNNNYRPVIDAPPSISRDGIRIRFELYKDAPSLPPSRGVVMLDKTHFRRWIASKMGDYREFVADLDHKGMLAYPEGSRKYLSKHTEVRTGQVRTIGLNLNTPQLQHMIENRGAQASLQAVASEAK